MPSRPSQCTHPGRRAAAAPSRGAAAMAAWLVLAWALAAPVGANPAADPPLMRSDVGTYLAGAQAERDRDFALAARLLGATLDSHPDDTGLATRVFLAALSAGERDRAVALAARLAKRDPAPRPLVALTLAVDALARGDTAGARANAGRIEPSGLARVTLPFLEGWTAVAAGDVQAGVAAFADSGLPSAFEPLLRVQTAHAHRLGGDMEAAEALLLPDGTDPAGLELSTQRELARIWVEQGRIEEARALIGARAAERPDSIALARDLAALEAGEAPEPLVASAQEGLAFALQTLASWARGQSDLTAMRYDRLALMLDPDLALAWLNLGDALQLAGRHRDAADAYGRIDPTGPLGFEAQLGVMSNLEASGAEDEAVAVGERLAGDYPDRFEPLMQLGNLHRLNEDWSEAVAAYDRAIARVPEAENRHWRLFYLRGIAHERAKQWDRAEADFQKALALEPDQPFVLNYLGYSWVEQGVNILEAKGMIQRAVAQEPENGAIVDSLGWVQYRIGQYAEAVVNLERAVQLRPQDPVINDHLGDAYWMVGRRLEARFQWKRALNLDPEADLRAVIADKLEHGMAPPDVIAID